MLEVDLSTAGMGVMTTTPTETPAEIKNFLSSAEFAAQTVEDFATANDTRVAINGNFFYPFYASTPISYYPKPGDLVQVSGLTISEGVENSFGEPKWPVLCVSGQNQATIESFGRCPANTYSAVAGNLMTIKDGEPIVPPNSDVLPRTVVGVNQAGDKLFILIVDGRQRWYSEGATHAFTQQIMQEAGAYEALNLDGGGSVTLVIEQDGAQRVFNAPIHTRIIGRQRPVANHLGIVIDE